MRNKVRLYKFYPLSSALRNLEQRRLKVSLLDELNDPFEFLNFQLPDRDVRDAWHTTRSQVFRDKGIICFSDNWRSPLMWAHYADSHKGLALGFDVPREYAIPVVYRKERTPFRYHELSSDERLKLIESSVATKFSHWEYESEYRMIVPIGNPEEINGSKMYFEEFGTTLELREVVIGARSAVASQEIRKAASNNYLKVTTSRVAFNSFEIVTQRNRNLQK